MSSGFGEANDRSNFSEGLSGHHQAIFADEPHIAGGHSALAAVLAHFAGVSSPQVVCHG